MKRLFVLFGLFFLYAINMYADILFNLSIAEPCRSIYRDDTSTPFSVVIDETDEIRKITEDYVNKYFPGQDPKKIIVVGFDTEDHALDNRKILGTCISGNINKGNKVINGYIIHLSSQNLPEGINDPNFKSTLIHELIHVYYGNSDLNHTKMSAVYYAKFIEAEYGIKLRYGNLN